MVVLSISSEKVTSIYGTLLATYGGGVPIGYRVAGSTLGAKRAELSAITVKSEWHEALIVIAVPSAAVIPAVILTLYIVPFTRPEDGVKVNIVSPAVKSTAGLIALKVMPLSIVILVLAVTLAVLTAFEKTITIFAFAETFAALSSGYIACTVRSSVPGDVSIYPTLLWDGGTTFASFPQDKVKDASKTANNILLRFFI